jgi:hypothetical protein
LCRLKVFKSCAGGYSSLFNPKICLNEIGDELILPILTKLKLHHKVLMIFFFGHIWGVAGLNIRKQ